MEVRGSIYLGHNPPLPLLPYSFWIPNRKSHLSRLVSLTLLHSGGPKLYGVLAPLGAIGSIANSAILFIYLFIYLFTGSPFQCLVDSVDGGYISVFGPGLVGGLSGQTESFTVVAKSGNLSKYWFFLIWLVVLGLMAL